WDGSDYAGCPVCHRRIDADDPFLRPVRAVRPPHAPVPRPLRHLRPAPGRSAGRGRRHDHHLRPGRHPGPSPASPRTPADDRAARAPPAVRRK
ncbi:RING finger family 4 domain-containing protein, partial [Streptomyces misionensis]|uniref:RING finger family 4 domain-containing protein n=1 Tax=Streptomyces misionensis TaxID=67331 RepID=UPI0037DA72AA